MHPAFQSGLKYAYFSETKKMQPVLVRIVYSPHIEYDGECWELVLNLLCGYLYNHKRGREKHFGLGCIISLVSCIQ